MLHWPQRKSIRRAGCRVLSEQVSVYPQNSVEIQHSARKAKADLVRQGPADPFGVLPQKNDPLLQQMQDTFTLTLHPDRYKQGSLNPSFTRYCSGSRDKILTSTPMMAFIHCTLLLVPSHWNLREIEHTIGHGQVRKAQQCPDLDQGHKSFDFISSRTRQTSPTSSQTAFTYTDDEVQRTTRPCTGCSYNRFPMARIFDYHESAALISHCAFAPLNSALQTLS